MTDANDTTSRSIRTAMAVTNSEATPLRLTLEPWAEERVIPPGGTALVSFFGPQGGRLEVEVKPNELILYGWVGSVLEAIDSE